jgi:hypothetical protein
MNNLLPATHDPGTPGDPDDLRAARLEMLIARLAAQHVSGEIGYWATFSDERGVSHCAFATDPAYADLSPENAARRTGAIAAIGRAVERYRAALTDLRADRESGRPVEVRRGSGRSAREPGVI